MPFPISGLAYSSDATTIVAAYQMQTAVTSSLACGTTPHSYTIDAVDNGLGSATSQQNVVAGLVPSTTYSCQITATNSAGSTTATFSLATTRRRQHPHLQRLLRSHHQLQLHRPRGSGQRRHLL